MIAAALIPVMGLTSCSVFNSGSGQTLANAAVLLAVSHYVKPKDAAKVVILANALDTVADVVSNKLTKTDFLALVSSVDDSNDWQILGSALYDVYVDSVKVPESASKYSASLHKLASDLRLAVGHVVVAK